MLFWDTVPLILSFHWWGACFWMLGFILLTRKSDGHHETDSDKKSWLKLVGHTTDLLPPTRPLPSLKKQPTCQFVALRRTCNTANVVIVLYYHWINTGPGILRQRSVVWWQRKVYNATHNWWWHFFWSISIDKYGCKGMKDVLIAKTMLLTRPKKTKQSHGRSLFFCLYDSYYLSSNVQEATNKWCSFLVN